MSPLHDATRGRVESVCVKRARPIKADAEMLASKKLALAAMETEANPSALELRSNEVT